MFSTFITTLTDSFWFWKLITFPRLRNSTKWNTPSFKLSLLDRIFWNTFSSPCEIEILNLPSTRSIARKSNTSVPRTKIKTNESAFQINPFVPKAPFLYPPKTSENLNLSVFSCFQVVGKGCIGSAWVKFPKACAEPCQKCKIEERVAKIVNRLQPLTIFAKHFMLYVS